MATVATAEEMKADFGKYLNLVLAGEEIVVTENGKEVGRFIPKGAVASFLIDSLTGIVKGDYDLDAVREEALLRKL